MGPSSSPSRSASWTEDSFEIRVLMEPFSETEMEGTSARSSIPREAGDEAGPSHQGGKIVQNESLESSMRNRIARLEQNNSPYLLEKGKGEYWAHIKEQLQHDGLSQGEYTRLLEFENRDLRIREVKHDCASSFQQVLLHHPALADQAPYHPPQEFLDDFLNERREALDRQAEKAMGQRPTGLGVSELDRREIAFLEDLRADLQKRGPAAIKDIFGKSPPSVSGNSGSA